MSNIFSIGNSVVSPFSLYNLRDLEEDSSVRRGLMDTGSDPILSEMSHSDRMEYLHHSTQWDSLEEAKSFNKTAHTEVKNILADVKQTEKKLTQIKALAEKLASKEAAVPAAAVEQEVVHGGAGTDLAAAEINRLRDRIDSQKADLQKRLDQVIDKARDSKVYGGTPGSVSLKQAGYTISNWSPVINNTPGATAVPPPANNLLSALVALKAFLDPLANLGVGNGNQGVAMLDDYIPNLKHHISILNDHVIENLSFDLATVDESLAKIKSDEAAKQELLEKFNVGAEAKRMSWAESKERMKRFVYSLDHEMAWSRQMTQKMFQSLA